MSAEDAPRGWYVYGIVGSDVEVRPNTKGLGDPPSTVEVVRDGEVAALVSQVDLDRPLGQPDDLLAHQRLLDDTIVAAPVLPIRFGAVLDSRDAVIHELLEPQEEAFAEALADLDDELQYVLYAQYEERPLIRDIVEADPEIGELAGQLRDRPPESTRDIRIRLGQAISEAIEQRRQQDTDTVLEAVKPVTVAAVVRDPVDDEQAAHVALLVSGSQQSNLEDVLGQLAEQWRGWATVQLTGPMAPYDFVVATSGDAQQVG
jgi:hypothetical protein